MEKVHPQVGQVLNVSTNHPSGGWGVRIRNGITEQQVRSGMGMVGRNGVIMGLNGMAPQFMFNAMCSA